MFKKLFISFLIFSFLIVCLFSFLIVVTNKRSFKQILIEKESQHKAEVKNTLERALASINQEMTSIRDNFKTISNEIKKSESTIFRRLGWIRKNIPDGGKGRAVELITVTAAADKVMTRFPNIRFIFLVDQSGDVEYGYPLTPLSYSYPKQLLKQFTTTGGFSAFLIGTGEGNQSIAVTFGMKLETEQQKKDKYITAKIHLSEPMRELRRLNEILRKDAADDDPQTGIFLVNTEGNILYRHNANNADNTLLKNIKDVWAGKLSQLKEHDMLHQENSYFLKSSLITGTDLVVMIIKKKKGLFFNELTQIQETSYKFLFYIVLACFIVGILLAILSARRIVKPISKLSERAERAEEGDYDTELILETGDELEHLSVVMHHFIKTTKETIGELEDELDLAKRIQQKLLPAKEDVAKLGVEIEYDLKIPKRVGGDYLDIIQLAENKLALIMADTSGDSFYGAFHITMIRALTHSYIRQLEAGSLSPKKFLTEMAKSVHHNRIHHEDHGADMVAFFFGILDTAKMEFSFCAAGHPPAFLFKACTGKIISVESPGLPLGVGPLDKHVYKTKKYRVNTDDLLLFFSDGLVEQRNSDGEEFGKDRLKQILINHNNIPVTELKQLIFQEFFLFKGGNIEQTDDISLILLRI